jgi:RND superfamily putative drug exporter
MRRLANLVTTAPRRMLALGFVFLVVAVVVGGPLPGLLGSGNEFNVPNSQSERAVDAAQEATGLVTQPLVLALVPTPQGATSPSGQRAITDAIAKLRAIEGIADVTPPTEQAGLVARDGTSVIVPAMARADAARGDVSEDATEAFAGSDVVLGGGAMIEEQINTQVQNDLLRAELIAMPLLILLSLWIFRSPIAALLPVLVGAGTVMGTFLTLRLINAGVYELSVFALNLVTGLGLGLAIDYSLLMVSRFREELAAGAQPRAAARGTMLTAGRTIVFSALTVSAAMLSLLVFPLGFLRSMAIAGAVVPLVACVVALTILSSALALLGRRVDALTPKRFVRREPTDAELPRTRWYRLARWVLARPGKVAGVTAAALILVGVPFLGARFTSVDASALPTSHSARQVSDVMHAKYPRALDSGVLIVAHARPDQAGQVQAYRDQVAALASGGAVSQPVPLGDIWQVTLVPKDAALASPTKALVKSIRALEPPFRADIGGVTAEFLDQRATLASRIPWAIAVLVGSTLILLFLMTGSVVLPIKAVLMNTLTVSATFGVLVMIFQWGNLTHLLAFESQGALEMTQPILLFAIAFALSTDYGTFLLARILEARARGRDDQTAVAEGLARTGRIVTAAALLLVCAIGAFATSEIVFIKLIGVGAALSTRRSSVRSSCRR